MAAYNSIQAAIDEALSGKQTTYSFLISGNTEADLSALDGYSRQWAETNLEVEIFSTQNTLAQLGLENGKSHKGAAIQQGGTDTIGQVILKFRRISHDK